MTRRHKETEREREREMHKETKRREQYQDALYVKGKDTEREIRNYKIKIFSSRLKAGQMRQSRTKGKITEY